MGMDARHLREYYMIVLKDNIRHFTIYLFFQINKKFKYFCPTFRSPLRKPLSKTMKLKVIILKPLVSILKPLTEKSKHCLINSEAFVARIKNAQINENHELVSFDVKSLFTSIPLDLEVESMKEALANHSSDPPIPKEEVLDLLTLCLQSTFFQYDGNFYQ